MTKEDTVLYGKAFCQFLMTGLVKGLNERVPISWQVSCLCLPSRPLAEHVAQAVWGISKVVHLNAFQFVFIYAQKSA